jgi:hypothetical protein
LPHKSSDPKGQFDPSPTNACVSVIFEGEDYDLKISINVQPNAVILDGHVQAFVGCSVSSTPLLPTVSGQFKFFEDGLFGLFGLGCESSCSQFLIHVSGEL